MNIEKLKNVLDAVEILFVMNPGESYNEINPFAHEGLLAGKIPNEVLEYVNLKKPFITESAFWSTNNKRTGIVSYTWVNSVGIKQDIAQLLSDLPVEAAREVLASIIRSRSNTLDELTTHNRNVGGLFSALKFVKDSVIENILKKSKSLNILRDRPYMQVLNIDLVEEVANYINSTYSVPREINTKDIIDKIQKEGGTVEPDLTKKMVESYKKVYYPETTDKLVGHATLSTSDITTLDAVPILEKEYGPSVVSDIMNLVNSTQDITPFSIGDLLRRAEADGTINPIILNVNPLGIKTTREDAIKTLTSSQIAELTQNTTVASVSAVTTLRTAQWNNVLQPPIACLGTKNINDTKVDIYVEAMQEKSAKDEEYEKTYKKCAPVDVKAKEPDAYELSIKMYNTAIEMSRMGLELQQRTNSLLEQLLAKS